MSDDEPQLSVVIPVFREAGNIGPLITETLAVMAGGAPIEIVVVDDGSDDETVAEVLAVTADPRVRLIRHKNRAGKSAAVWTGGHAARGHWMVTLDGDGQNDPRDARMLMDRFAETPPPDSLWIVCGRRRRRHDGAVKWLTSRTGNFLRRHILRDNTRDTGCGFKLFRTHAFRRLPYFDNMHRFYPALIIRAGGETMDVMVNDRPRQHGQSKYGFFDRAAVAGLDIIGVYWLSRRASFPVVDEDPV